MFLVGLTGGIASGKSMVASMFQDYGIPVISADEIAREVVLPGTRAWKKIQEEFGSKYITAEGMVDRKALGDLIFQDEIARKKLNAITHPEIYKQIAWHIVKHFFHGHQFVIMELPLLFESGATLSFLHKIIVVTCSKEDQLQRLQERNQLTLGEAEARVNAQWPLDEKCARADYIIHNSGSLSKTEEQVTRMYLELKESYAHLPVRLLVGTVVLGALSTLAYMVVHSH